jgi:hypothetical protein
MLLSGGEPDPEKHALGRDPEGGNWCSEKIYAEAKDNAQVLLNSS